MLCVLQHQAQVGMELRHPLLPLAVSSDVSFSLPVTEILCAFSDYIFGFFALLLKDPLLLFPLWSSHLCKSVTQKLLLLLSASNVFVWDSVTRLGAHLGLRHLLVKLSDSIQNLKYLNNYLNEGQGVTPLCFSEKKMFSDCNAFPKPY